MKILMKIWKIIKGWFTRRKDLRKLNPVDVLIAEVREETERLSDDDAFDYVLPIIRRFIEESKHDNYSLYYEPEEYNTEVYSEREIHVINVILEVSIPAARFYEREQLLPYQAEISTIKNNPYVKVLFDYLCERTPFYYHPAHMSSLRRLPSGWNNSFQYCSHG